MIYLCLLFSSVQDQIQVQLHPRDDHVQGEYAGESMEEGEGVGEEFLLHWEPPPKELILAQLCIAMFHYPV